MTEYTPTEPEITQALADLTRDIRYVAGSNATAEVADRIVMDRVSSRLAMFDEPGMDPVVLVRRARAFLAARERWAEQETKAA